jgi:DNA polymerase-3 subunit alpha
VSQAAGRGDPTQSFAHCHVHTEFSILDGASRIDDVVAAAVADGQPALSITDHGNMYGVLPFYAACTKAGVTPLLGTEAYMAYERRDERINLRGTTVDDTGGDVEGGRKAWYHLTLLAESNTGYANLIKLSSRSFLEGYYRKPKCDWELLADHAEGLIATTGCLGGHVAQSLLTGNFDDALAKAARLQEIFGKDNLFVELQDHGIAEQHQVTPQLVEIARRIGAPLLATNDSHYTRPEDAQAHDALLCVQTKATIDQPGRFQFKGSGHYLKSAAEMRRLFAELPEACDNTLLIARRADVRIELGTPKLPDFKVPPEFSSAGEYLSHVTFEGAKARWGDKLPDVVVERLAYELKVIEDMGFSSYFLIVWDLIRHAKDHGIRVGPGRGSAAGCAVAYCLRITELDPIRYDLLFERFLNPSRLSMPDIDMDFDSRYRDEMIRYAAERYGRDHVAQIITFGTIKARASVRDAARVLGYPYAVGDRVAKAMPPIVMGRDTPLWACVADEPQAGFEDGWKIAAELRTMVVEDPDVARVVTVAKGLEGLRRQDGIHAAAVVITKDPLTDYLPVQRKPEPGGDPEDSPVVTQYEMHGVEDLGLLKMDFLGLRNLDVITDTVELIKTTRGQELDIDHVTLEDGPTYELLQRGDSVGVFQLEGGPMRTLMRSLAPTCFEDVAALIALYRPGPMAANMHFEYADRKNGRKKVEYLHPDAEPILADTFGLMIYQEKLMRVAQQFAGYSLAESDNLRRACGKKIREVMRAEREKFVTSVERNGYTRQLGEKWFDIMEPFADYAFAKSHAFGYGLIAYQTAYLKANYPTEYLAALLTSVRENLDRAGVYLAECRALGITVSVPDVNRSAADFTPVVGEGPGEGTILFGLAAVRNVGTSVAEAIVAEREARGPFADFSDFCERVPIFCLNKQPMDALIRAGAFDSLGHTRKGLLHVHELIVGQIVARRREREQGVLSLFGDADGRVSSFDQPVAVPDVEFDKRERLAHEKEMLGLYVSDHPLLGLESALRRRADGSLSEVTELPEGSMRVFAGVITGLQVKWTKRGEQMAVFMLEDLESSIEVTVFPRTMVQYAGVIADDSVVTVRARIDKRDDLPKLIASEITAFGGAPASSSEPLRVRLPVGSMSVPVLDSLKEVLAAHHGDVPVHLYLAGQGSKGFRLPPEYCVDTSNGVVAALRVSVPGIEILAEAPALTDLEPPMVPSTPAPPVAPRVATDITRSVPAGAGSS